MIEAPGTRKPLVAITLPTIASRMPANTITIKPK